MTLKQVRDWHIGKGGKASAYRHMGVAGMHYAMADAIDERIKADEMAAQSARERVEMALREPNSAKAAQVASELGAAHRAAKPIDLAAIREVIADMRMAKSPYCQAWADKLASALQENAK